MVDVFAWRAFGNKVHRMMTGRLTYCRQDASVPGESWQHSETRPKGRRQNCATCELNYEEERARG